MLLHFLEDHSIRKKYYRIKYASGADFSSNTLDGITIVADYAVKTSIITNCTIICSDAVELAGLTTNCKVQSNN